MIGAEINRAKWIGVAESHMPFVWAPEADAGGSSLHFMLDCIYSYFDGRETNTMFKNIRQIEKNIMSTIDRKTAVLSRVLYPTLSDLSESGYLAMQEDRRYDRWSKIVPKVYARRARAEFRDVEDLQDGPDGNGAVNINRFLLIFANGI